MQTIWTAGKARIATQRAPARVLAFSGPSSDTVSAGATVTGAILSSLTARSVPNCEALQDLTEAVLSQTAHHAISAAWPNCQHSGCHPPTLQDVEALRPALVGHH